MATQELLKKETLTVTEKVLAIKITSPKIMAEASELLSKINKKGDAIKAEKEKVTKPLNQALKAEQARWKPAEDAIKKAVSHLRVEMGSYQTLLVKKSEETKNIIIGRIGSGKGKLKIETASKQLSEVDAPEAKVETESGSISFRDDYEVTVVDKHLIPVEFLEVDFTAIKKALKNGDIIHGVTFTTIKVPVNRRN